jgi:hypothetical protein
MAATGNQTNISKYLLGNNAPKIANKLQILPTLNDKTNALPSINYSTFGRIFAYIVAILIIILVILLFIHFFIKPVFRLRPGTPGIIPVPGLDDGVLFWKSGNTGQILNKDLPIQSTYYNYSLILDVYIQNPLQFSNYPRIIFSRGSELKEKPSGDTMLGVLNNYNFAAGLLPDTNDLIVSVLNKDNNMENIIIPNIPIQEPFRLGMVLMEAALEVYINGHLMKTRTFTVPPKDVRGDIYPALGIEANIAKLRNLKIWPRILTTNEIRYASPSLSAASTFNASPIATSSTSSCASDVMSRMDKLSAETVSDMSSLQSSAQDATESIERIF